MPETTDQDAALTAARAARRARLARVGILRNPNRKPMPPPRQPPLIGRHLRLQSSRRPPAGRAEAPPAPPDESPLVVEDDGRIARIDVDRLAALADLIGEARPARRRFGAPILGGEEHAATPPRPPAAPALERPPEATVAEAEGEAGAGEAAAPPPAVWRRLLARLIQGRLGAG